MPSALPENRVKDAKTYIYTKILFEYKHIFSIAHNLLSSPKKILKKFV